jgi:hypothetical protein
MSTNTRNQRLEAKSAPPHSHSINSQTRRERFVLFLSYIHFLATLTATLLFVELVRSDSMFTHDTGFWSRALLPIGLLGVLNIPFYFLIRFSGIRKFHFREHEARLDETHFLPAESRFRDKSPDIDGEMQALIQAIDAADVWDRQAARHAAKAWVIKNRPRLDEAAWAFLRENVGYLLPEE